MKSSKTIVIGGGAAGMMAAGRAAERGGRVLLLEKMERTGRKIGISGKGRCNLGNSAPLPEFINHFGKNGRFLRHAFQHFFTSELIDFLTKRNVPVITERGGRIFPASGKALDVVRAIDRYIKAAGVEIQLGTQVTGIIAEKGKIQGVLVDNNIVPCDSVILATGGKSYPRTGSTGDGYSLAAALGHTIVPTRPALVPLSCSEPNCSPLDGLTLRNVMVRLYVDGKCIAKEFGEMAFTKFGVSGPVILGFSLLAVDAIDHGSDVILAIDLKPALDHEKLEARLLRDLAVRHDRPIEEILHGLMPRALVPLCMESCGLAPGQTAGAFPAAARKKLRLWLKDLRCSVSGYRSFDEAIITAGGVDLNQVDPKTMQSKLVTGLYIVGELLDLQADTGGFNLQAAFSTGWLAGSSVPVP